MDAGRRGIILPGGPVADQVRCAGTGKPLPLSAVLFGVCPGGVEGAWRSEGRVAGVSKVAEVPPLGGFWTGPGAPKAGPALLLIDFHGS